MLRNTIFNVGFLLNKDIEIRILHHIFLNFKQEDWELDIKIKMGKLSLHTH